MKNYTTGEWLVNDLSLNETAFEILTSRPTENGMNGNIAYLKCGHYTNKRQARANANLIAAAPDMLEALQSLKNDDNSINQHSWKLVQDAINKALDI